MLKPIAHPNKNIFIIPLVLVVSLCSLLGGTLLLQDATEHYTMPYQKRIKKVLDERFKRQEFEIMKRFFTMTNLNQKTWNQWQQACKPNFLADEQNFKNECLESNEPLSQETQEKLQTILNDYGMAHIDLVPASDWSMAACAHFITVNEDDLMHDQWIEHGILHEINHIKHNDYFTGYCMECMLCACGVPEKAMNKFLQEYNHFKEIRTELCALLSKKAANIEEHLEYIRGYQEAYFGCKRTDDISFNHPCAVVYYENIDYLCALMEQSLPVTKYSIS